MRYSTALIHMSESYGTDKDSKSQIVIEVIGKYSKTHKITYGIVAYSFFIRVSLFVSRVSCLDFNTIIPYYMFLGQ